MNSRIANLGAKVLPLENDKPSSFKSLFAAYMAKHSELQLKMSSGKLREKCEAHQTSEPTPQEEFACYPDEGNEHDENGFASLESLKQQSRCKSILCIVFSGICIILSFALLPHNRTGLTSTW